MNCCICQQKTSEILYPILPMKNFPGYLKQFGVNNKMAYKTSCMREYVHMRCAVFIHGLKWVKEQFKKKNNFKQIDYVCFGFEQVQLMKLKKQECSICLSIFETRTVQHWRKTISVIIDCEHPQCGKSFHVDCLIQRKKRILFDRSVGQLHILCQQHCRSQNPALEELNWDAIENAVTHIVHTNLVSRDQEYQKYVSNDSVEIPEEQQAEEIQFDGQRNVQKYYQQPSINSEYSKPKPLYDISYQRKQAQPDPIPGQRFQRKPPPSNSNNSNTAPNFNLFDQMQSESEHEGKDPEVPQNEEDYYQQYYKKPSVDDRIYEQRNSEEKKSETRLNRPPDYIQIAPLDLPEDIDMLPKSRSPSLEEQDRFTHQYINKQYEPKPRPYVTTTLQEENQEGRIVIPKQKNSHPSEAENKFKVKKLEEPQLQRYQVDVGEEPRPIKKVQREDNLIRRQEPKITYVIQLVNNEPVYPDEEEKRDDAMKAYWKSIDVNFFPNDLPEENLALFEEQFNPTNQELDEPVPSISMSSNHLINIIAQGFDTKANWFLQYGLIKNINEPDYLEKLPMKDNGEPWPTGIISLKNNTGEAIQITRVSQISADDLSLLNVCNITSKEYQSCVSYQQFLNSRPPSLTSDLDLEYQFLMEECGAMQDETRLQKREIIEKYAVHKTKDHVQMFIMGEKIIDELRWLEVAKYIRLGLLKKDQSVLRSFELEVSPSFKKIKHIYPSNNFSPIQSDCKICFYHRNNGTNQVVYCDNCDCSYHKWCYGIVEGLEDKIHLCDVCTFQKKHNVPINKVNCFLCKQHYPGVPLKQLRGNFFHVTCLFLANFILFEHRSLLIQRQVTWQRIETIITKCEVQKCFICGEMKGKKEKCLRNDCHNHFHVLCAYLYGLEMGVAVDLAPFKDTSSKSNKIGVLEVSIRCHCHDTPSKKLIEQVFYRRYPINYKQASLYTDTESYISKLDDKPLFQLISTEEQTLNPNQMDIENQQSIQNEDH